MPGGHRDGRPYRTLDGNVCILIYTDKHWKKFFEAIGKPEMFVSDVRFSTHGERTRRIDEVYGYLAGVIATRRTAEWLDLFASADIPAARMYSMEDLLVYEHLAAIGYFRRIEHPTEGLITTLAVPTEWSDSVPDEPRHAPALGEDTVTVLREAGYSNEAIDALLSQGAVMQR